MDAQAIARDLRERLGHKPGHAGVATGIAQGRELGERLNQSDAERPDVRRRHDASMGDLWSVVSAQSARGSAQAAGVLEPVGRELDLIVDDEDVGWSYLAVDQPASMQVLEGVEDGGQHLSNFGAAESAGGKHLIKRLVGHLHYDIEELVFVETAVTALEDAKEVWMGKAFGLGPIVELVLGSINIGGNKADGGLLRGRTGQFSAVEVAGFGTAKMLEEGEALVDKAAHPFDGGSFGFHCHNPILSGIAHAGCVDSGTSTGSTGGSHFVVFEWDYTRI